MYLFGKGSYNRRYDNENKYESSLSNVYRDLITSKKDNPVILQYDSKNSSNSELQINLKHKNYFRK